MDERSFIRRLVLLAAVAVVSIAPVAPGMAAPGNWIPSDNERFGFGVVTDITQFDVSRLHAGWYVNWGAAPSSPHPDGLEYVQILRLCDPEYKHCSAPYYTPNGSKLAAIVRANPGTLWLVGNEPDCPYQDSVGPERYARTYHDVYATLKSLDPTAKVGIGGMVQASVLRMKWLNRVWSAYRSLYGTDMPVDVWNVHAFVLREVRPGHRCDNKGVWGAGIPPGLTDNCGLLVDTNDLDRMDIFDQQIRRFRQWMKDHGQQNKPLIVSEYGILFNQELGYGYERVRDYMLGTFDYFLNTKDTSIGFPADDYRLVQKWAWYSLDDDSFGWGTTWSALFDPRTHQIKQLGVEFGKYAQPLVHPYVDLAPTDIRVTSPPVYGRASSLGVSTDVFNWGNVQSPSTSVRAYVGGSAVGTGPLPPVPRRYAGERKSSIAGTVTISGPTVVRVAVDPDNRVQEWREGNNVLTSTIRVDLSAVGISADPTVPFVEGAGAQALGASVPMTGTHMAFFPRVDVSRRASVTLTLKVRNDGDVIVPAAQVRIGEGTTVGSNAIGTATLPSIAPGQEKTISVVWTDAPPGPHEIWAEVDPQNDVHEGDESNNAATMSLLVAGHRAFVPLGMR